MAKKRGSTASYTVILIFTTALAKALGFGREMSLAYVYGASPVSDAYIVAFSIPTIIFAGIGSAMLTSYISSYARIRQQNPRRLRRFTDTVITMVILISLVIMGVFWLFKEPIVKLFAMGFEGEVLEIAVSLAQVIIVSLLPIGVYFILQGYLQIHGSYFAVGMVSAPLNICVISSMFLSQYYGQGVLGWGVVAGYFSSYLMLYIAAKQHRFSYRFNFQFNTPEIRRLLVVVIPIFLGKAITELNTMIDRTIASVLPSGSVSALSYGNRVVGFVTAVFVISVTTAAFPQMSQLSAMKNHRKLKRTFARSVGLMSLMVLPISAGVILFANEIVAMLFQRGAFTAFDTQRTAEVVTFYSIGLIFFSIKEVALNMFYAIEDTVTPTINSILAIVINIVLNLLLIKSMAHKGLALATTISGGLTLVMLLVVLRHRIGPLGLGRVFASLVKMAVATAGMCLAARPLYDLLYGATEMMLLCFILAALAGALVYALLNVLLRTREMGVLVVGLLERFFPS
ncbi:MAG: murein biosynthesis integral membrane protein MurJ [Angelakisella sp.]|jgi:putative peptidoglycan lipid II flippase|nr:murein biosynthesis integral membrane protein MurJ [Angelakisella sp.]